MLYGGVGGAGGEKNSNSLCAGIVTGANVPLECRAGRHYMPQELQGH